MKRSILQQTQRWTMSDERFAFLSSQLSGSVALVVHYIPATILADYARELLLEVTRLRTKNDPAPDRVEDRT